MLGEDFGSNQHIKKKKKRSFVQKQKRFAKHGSCGRGSQLPSDMVEYFINIIKVTNSKKDDDEEMSILASNVFHEIDGKESEYCCNQIISRAVENLLPYSTDEEFAKFLDKFSENLRPLFCDPFGSHVLQQTVMVSYLKYQKLLSEQKEDKLHVQFFNYILRISNFIFNNLEDFIWDVYSNKVTITVFNILSGNPVKGEVKPSDSFSDEKEECSEKNIPSEFESLIKKYAKKIVSWPQFNELCNQPVNSNFLQSLLIASKNTEENSEMVEKIISVYESNPLDLTDDENQPFLRLLEVILCIIDKATFERIYKLIFKKNLCELAKSKNGNFAIQKLITNCSSKKIFGKIFAKLEGEMEEILKIKYTGVLFALVKKCHTLEILQGECMAMLTRIFGAKETKEIVPLVVSLTSKDDFDFESWNITLNGALIVQELLHFKKPINVVNSLLELSEQKLVRLLSDPKGCHITDAFVKSSFVGEKSRDKLFKKLKGHYLELATSKHGSRSMDTIWSVISLQDKATLAEELKSKQSELCADIYGRGFARKIHLDNFRRSKEEWIKVQKTGATAEKYFSDIIPKKKQKTC